jgi:hypothetical protein
MALGRTRAGEQGSGGGLLRLAERTGLIRGIGGSRGWFYLGTGLWTLRTVRRLALRRSEVLVSEELRPGDRIVIANGRATIDHAAPLIGEVVAGRRGRRRG